MRLQREIYVSLKRNVLEMRWSRALRCDPSLARDVLRLQGEMCLKCVDYRS